MAIHNHDPRTPDPEPAPWELPVPFDDRQLPSFPAWVLPGWLRDFVLAESTATQTPHDLAGLLALAVLST
ncbi:MAG: hypothetical protein M3O34_08180, partial [Chloroflexota bacterium]|nr:hypothetical protein [Chloroflexota bacterium]